MGGTGAEGGLPALPFAATSLGSGAQAAEGSEGRKGLRPSHMSLGRVALAASASHSGPSCPRRVLDPTSAILSRAAETWPSSQATPLAPPPPSEEPALQTPGRPHGHPRLLGPPQLGAASRGTWQAYSGFRPGAPLPKSEAGRVALLSQWQEVDPMGVGAAQRRQAHTSRETKVQTWGAGLLRLRQQTPI